MRPTLLVLTLFLGVAAGIAPAQDTLNEMPRYDRYEKLRREISGSVKYGIASVNWADDGKSLTYRRDDKTYRLDLATGQEAEVAAGTSGTTTRRGQTRRAPERGRQFETAFSPDEKRKAFHRDGNVYLSDADGKNEVAITTDGSREKRIKYGVASWVYGEELEVREAMWWSPDGTRLAFYRFDESPVKDYYLQYDQTKIQDTLDVEAYPKAGAANPIVGLLVMDVATRKVTPIDTKFGDATLGEYVYDVRWAPDGKQLLFNRTNRKQNEMELCAADPATGKSRAIVRESQPQSWAENHPTVQFLKDNRRFVWSSERNGFKNLYLYDLDGKLLSPLTQHQADVERVLRVDEDRKVLYYTARTGNNPYLAQLHRVGLDGKGDRRLTDPALHHTVSLSPDGRHFSDVAQNATTPPTTRLLSEDGKVVKELAKSDVSSSASSGWSGSRLPPPTARRSATAASASRATSTRRRNTR
jgi:dipeptidyl-peptidase-4